MSMSNRLPINGRPLGPGGSGRPFLRALFLHLLRVSARYVIKAEKATSFAEYISMYGDTVEEGGVYRSTC
ncbi:hypothetical protein PISMIDRAFT_245483 [Pisolithus microcarpus 441]|uniref:Uncharacterized protein n=1 Tax=Pisolithus microcarpus 441 TaxID=765257 RepID=A0A0C9ZLA6_9AGAM|nr:hypothetical protein PISMIDRAFT_245483 [Pisolithus microcarpus 441]